VFTARYALSPYIKLIRFVLKGLKPFPRVTKESSHYPKTPLSVEVFFLALSSIIDPLPSLACGRYITFFKVSEFFREHDSVLPSSSSSTSSFL
jgi:hypothetical protein